MSQKQCVMNEPLPVVIGFLPTTYRAPVELRHISFVLQRSLLGPLALNGVLITFRFTADT